MKNRGLMNMVLSAFFIAIGLVLPFLTGQIPEVGSMLLPMHIPVFLCGLICGPWYGLGVGFILPIMRSLIFFMPPMYPKAIGMAFELAAYGLVSGYLYKKSPWKCTKAVYKAMIPAMIIGRAVWGISQVILLGVRGNSFTLTAFVTGAFLEAVPGIVIQLVLIPAVMVALGKAKLVPLSNRVEDKKCRAK